jgi:hypothetical protein
MRFAEQEELVRSLEQKQAQQSSRWRVRFRFPDSSGLTLLGGEILPWVRGAGFCLDLAIPCSHNLLFCAARLRGIPPGLRGLPGLLQLPPRLVSLGAGWLLNPIYYLLLLVLFMAFGGRLCPIIDIYLVPAINWGHSPQIPSMLD